jgi:hypothetical protein
MNGIDDRYFGDEANQTSWYIPTDGWLGNVR